MERTISFALGESFTDESDGIDPAQIDALQGKRVLLVDDNEDRLWLQVPDLVLKLYHSFPLFPKPPVFNAKTGGFDILLLQLN